MDKRLEQLPKLSKETFPETQKYFKMLKRRTPKNLDVVMKELHEDEFKKTDCCLVVIVVKQPVLYLQIKILNVFRNI